MATEFSPYGLYRMNICLLNSSGYPIGSTASPANGSTNNALYIKKVRGVGWSQQQGNVIPFEGGDVVYGQAAYASGGFQPFEIETHSHNKTLQAMVLGTSIDSTTNSSYPTTGNNPRRAIMPNVGLILTSYLQSHDTGTSGQTQYEHFVFPSCTVEWIYGAPSFQAQHVSRLRVTPTIVTKNILGVAFGANQGFTDNATDMYDFQSVYPVHLASFISDASATTFTPLYKAISSVVTSGASPNWMAKNGTTTALSSVNTSTGVMTLAAAGTAADMHVVLYQHNEAAA